MNKRRMRELADHIEAPPHYLRRDPEVTDAFGPDYTGPAPDLFSMAYWHSGVYVLGDGTDDDEQNRRCGTVGCITCHAVALFGEADGLPGMSIGDGEFGYDGYWDGALARLLDLPDAEADSLAHAAGYAAYADETECGRVMARIRPREAAEVLRGLADGRYPSVRDAWAAAGAAHRAEGTAE